MLIKLSLVLFLRKNPVFFSPGKFMHRGNGLEELVLSCVFRCVIIGMMNL